MKRIQLSLIRQCGIGTAVVVLLAIAAPVHAGPFVPSIFTNADGDMDGSLGYTVNYYSPLASFFRQDCNDANNSVSPYASDIGGDGIDGNCDGLDISAPSHPLPVAVTPDYAITAGSGLTLDASGSHSANGSITNYYWFLDDSGNPAYSTTAPTVIMSQADVNSYFTVGVQDIGLIVMDELNLQY